MAAARRVGMDHHPLADVLKVFVRTGLAIEHVAELGRSGHPSHPRTQGGVIRPRVGGERSRFALAASSS
jgi:hypothetical protein